MKGADVTDNKDARSIKDDAVSLTLTNISKLVLGAESKLYSNIFLISYVCDFDNVVINSVKKKQFQVKNLGPIPIEFFFDNKYFRSLGFSIQPERVQKLPVGEEVTVTVTYQAKKSMKFGKIFSAVPIEVKNGARYYLQLSVNVTIPEITLQNLADGLDFGEVLCGQRKTIYALLANEKEINCSWSLIQRLELQGDR